jgi:hypothetical protein
VLLFFVDARLDLARLGRGARGRAGRGAGAGGGDIVIKIKAPNSDGYPSLEVDLSVAEATLGDLDIEVSGKVGGVATKKLTALGMAHRA